MSGSGSNFSFCDQFVACNCGFQLWFARHQPSARPPLRFHTDPRVAGAGPLLKADKIGSPMTGGDQLLRVTAATHKSHTLFCVALTDFTVADDVSAIAPIVVSIANRFAECGKSCLCKERGLSVVVTRPRDARLWC